MGEFIAILAVGLPVISVVVGMVYQHRSRTMPHRDALARSSAQVAEYSTQIHTLAESLRRSVDLVRSGFAEDEARDVLAGIPDRLRRADELLTERDRLADARAGMTWRTGPEELERAAARWQELERDAESLLTVLRESDQRYSQVLAASTSLGERTSETARLIDQVQAAAEHARSQGYAVDAEAPVLSTAHGRLTEIRELASEGRPLAGKDALSELTQELSTALSSLRTIGDRESRSRRRLEELAEARQENDARRSAAVAALDGLTAGYAAAVHDGMHTRLEAGDRCASEVDDHVRTARSELDRGDVQRAETALDTAEQAHRSAGEEFGAPVERLEKVRELSSSLPGRRSETLIRLTEMAERAGSDEGSEHLSPVLQTLRARVESLDMERDRPDWLRLEDGLDEADALADSVSEASETAVRAADRMRSETTRLERALRWSEEERKRSEEYMRKELGTVPALALRPSRSTGPSQGDAPQGPGNNELERALARLRFLDTAAEKYSWTVSTSLFNPRAAATAARDYAAAVWAAGRLDEATQIAEEARDRYAKPAGQDAVTDFRVLLSLIDAERAARRE